jgi:SWI/SNF-related matrix-associated actin-dependent regulator 1 of chromatin subfamily A
VQGFKRKNGPAGLSSNTFRSCVEILENYGIVDDVLERCERMGQEIQRVVDGWTAKTKLVEGFKASSEEEGALKLSSLNQISAGGFLRKQPATLSKGVKLKEYQLIGLNWLNLLFLKKRSCILADEMGKSYNLSGY